jgi:hypothetical protein
LQALQVMRNGLMMMYLFTRCRPMLRWSHGLDNPRPEAAVNNPKAAVVAVAVAAAAAVEKSTTVSMAPLRWR